MLDRVTERRRAAQLARHYRDQEGLSIAEIARRLGRAEATIKSVSLRSNRREGTRGQGALPGSVSRLRGAHRAAERQGRRLRVLQTLPSRRDCAGMDPGTGSRSDARMASALRRCAVLLRLVPHARTPARRRSAQTTTGRRMARTVHCHRSVRELGGGSRRRVRRCLNAWASNAVDIRTRACAWPSLNGAPKVAANASAMSISTLSGETIGALAFVAD